MGCKCKRLLKTIMCIFSIIGMITIFKKLKCCCSSNCKSPDQDCCCGLSASLKGTVSNVSKDIKEAAENVGSDLMQAADNIKSDVKQSADDIKKDVTEAVSDMKDLL